MCEREDTERTVSVAFQANTFTVTPLHLAVGHNVPSELSFPRPLGVC